VLSDLTSRLGIQRPGWKRWVLAFAFGGLPLFSFPNPALWWWAFIALVPATLIIATSTTRRSALACGWFAGAGYGTAAIYWTVPNLGPGLLLIAFGLGALYIPWGWMIWEAFKEPTGVLRAVTASFLIPFAWLAAEYIRSWSSLGGPWAVLGTSQWNNRDFLSIASVGGVWLVSLVLVGVNTTICLSLMRSTSRPAKVTILSATLLIVSGCFVYGILRPSDKSGSHLRVAVVQPGPGLGPARNFAYEVNLTEHVAASHPQLVVWGESSINFDLASAPGQFSRLEQLSAITGSDLLVNDDAKTSPKGGIYKTAILIGPHSVLSSYEKMRLVPFGEYIPLRGELGWLSSISRAAKVDRRRGHHLNVMQLGNDLPPIGVLICFEGTFPDMSRHLSGMDAQVIVIQNSDSTFQQSWEPAQQASLGAVRAVESGRPVVEASLTGDSAIFDARGRVLAWHSTSFRGAFLVDVPLTFPTTPFVRWGDWAPWGSIGLLLFASLCAIVFRPRL